MTTKTRTLYMIREDIGCGNTSKQLGQRLRPRADAMRIVRIMKKAGRDVFTAPVAINADEFGANGRRISC